MGLGSRLKVFADGKLIGCKEIATGYGYASGQPAMAHFGLGKVETVDLEVTLPHGKGTITKKSIKAGQRILIKG
jgi:hypothetical protein